MKHHVRRAAWLPLCRRQLDRIRAKQQRRLKYFTFCAVEAIDVLMLDVAKVVRRSNAGHFDTIFFFIPSPDGVLNVRRSLPGAIGFAGDFESVVLLDDPNEDDDVTRHDHSLEPRESADTKETRQQIVTLDTQRRFRQSFPFDVTNLDLEGYLFKKREKIPGRLINAFRKVFAWQRRDVENGKGLESFGLMFTTKVGPEDMGSDFMEMLQSALQSNLEANADLRPILEGRTGTADVPRLIGENFQEFFKLAAAKMIVETLMEEDWHIAPEFGVEVYEFERHPEGAPPYKMLHLVMDVFRNTPPRNRRAPGQVVARIAETRKEVIKALFQRPAIEISEGTIERDALREDLGRIEGRRALYVAGQAPED